MLSYRHSFHAGNFADLLKHIVLVDILDYLRKKDAALEYIDTHAGAGLFDLRSPDAQKLQEYSNGIGKINAEDFPELARYFEVIDSFNPNTGLDFYPGSPSIARFFLRPQDRAWLFELHPKDVELLKRTMHGSKNIKVELRDGFDGLKALLPPVSRRGLMLIDPSYEIKSDYSLVVRQLIDAHRKFSQGVFALWYPVIDRRVVDGMVSRIVKSGIRNIQRFELGLCADSEGRGMTSSGMVVVNPPWGLLDRMAEVLPRLAGVVGDGEGVYRCEVVAGE